MVDGGEAIAAEVTGPSTQVFVIARGRSVVLCTGCVESRVVWIPRGAVKLSDWDVFEVFPRRSVVLGFVESAVGGQNARLRPQPLQVVLVCVHFIRPPLWPHEVPVGSAVDGIPQVHPEDGDVIGIEGVDAHLGEIPSESTQGVLGNVVFWNDGAPGFSAIGGAVQVVQLAVLSDHKGVDALGRVGQSDAPAFPLAPGIGQDLPVGSVVHRFPNAAMRSPHFTGCRVACSLPRRRVNGLGIGVVKQVGHTRRIIGQQNLFPIAPRICAPKQSTVRVGLGGVSHCSSEEHGSCTVQTRNKQQFADDAHGIQPHVFPRAPAVQ